MDHPHHTLISLLLPEGILEYFELTHVEKAAEGLSIYLEEKNIAPSEYQSQRLESKGFLPEVSIQDFPIRGQKWHCESKDADGKLLKPV